MEEEKQGKAHALMICTPYQGHMNPLVNLALKLASKGIIITFVHLEFVHRKLSKAHQGSNSSGEVDIFREARESGLDIRYTTISDPFPPDFDGDIHSAETVRTFFRKFPAIVDEFVGMITQSQHQSSFPVPNIFVADTICKWSADVSKKYNLVNVSFWTAPVLAFSLGYHLDLLSQNGHFPSKDSAEEINYIPGVKSISTRDFMTYLRESANDFVRDEVMSGSFEQAKKADLILHNTVEELESETLSALNKYQPNYAIGPIHFSTNLLTNSVSKSLFSESDCSHWLDSKPPGSVLYISFGSNVQTSKQVIDEIAYGLLLSGVSFIWVVRSGLVSFGDSKDVLPNGFEDEIKDRGLIVPWCNQIEVLSNPATGGFLTHCGWNSTIESMWCGVPMICYPIAYDQPTNRKLIVDDWKIGINLCDGPSVDRSEVAEKMNKFMSEGAVGLKEEANKVKAILHNAKEVNGSSERNFDHFVNLLKTNIH